MTSPCKIRNEPQPRVTFYLTLVFEHHAASEQYTYSIDRCYTSLAQANDRLGLLSRCNANTANFETIRAGEDKDTGCQWCTWTRPDADGEVGNFRFYAEVKRVVMLGHIRSDGPSEQEVLTAEDLAGGLGSTAEYKYSFEHKKDLANHVWAVALHDPARSISVDERGKPTQLPWVLEGVFEASGNAMARGKRLWRDKLSQTYGRFDRLDSHYGFARYLLVPLNASSASSTSSMRRSVSGERQRLSIEDTAQIRVERIKVMPQGEMVAMFAPAEAILFNKPFQPLYKGRNEEKERAATAKADAELLSLFDAAGEDAEEHNIATPSPVSDPRTLAPPPIRKRELKSAQQKSFRPGVVQEYSEIAATLRDPAKPPSISKAQKAMHRLSLGRSMASAKKHIYHAMVGEDAKRPVGYHGADGNGSPRAKDEYRRRGSAAEFGAAGMPPLTPGQAALAAQQTLLLASQVKTL